jgi:hypothetical protein
MRHHRHRPSLVALRTLLPAEEGYNINRCNNTWMCALIGKLINRRIISCALPMCPTREGQPGSLMNYSPRVELCHRMLKSIGVDDGQ